MSSSSTLSSMPAAKWRGDPTAQNGAAVEVVERQLGRRLSGKTIHQYAA
jgi:hypothetical protein